MAHSICKIVLQFNICCSIFQTFHYKLMKENEVIWYFKGDGTQRDDDPLSIPTCLLAIFPQEATSLQLLPLNSQCAKQIQKNNVNKHWRQTGLKRGGAEFETYLVLRDYETKIRDLFSTTRLKNNGCTCTRCTRQFGAYVN